NSESLWSDFAENRFSAIGFGGNKSHGRSAGCRTFSASSCRMDGEPYTRLPAKPRSALSSESSGSGTTNVTRDCLATIDVFASPVRRTIFWSDVMASLESEGYRHRASRDEGHGLLEPLAAARDRRAACGWRGADRDPNRKARAGGRPRRNGHLRHLGLVAQDA